MTLSLFEKTTASFVVLIVFAIVLNSCKKESTTSINPPVDTDTTTNYAFLAEKAISSASGFVTNENNVIVSGAEVRLGDKTTQTNKYGFFKIEGAQVPKQAAVITVSSPGYFKSYKTYIANGANQPFFRIKLLPEVLAGYIDAGSGGTVNLLEGFSITLPANAVVNAATKAAYTGTVNLYIQVLNPLAADLYNTMPGDLRGVDKTASLQLLTSYGMAAVELKSPSGEMLQLANGKKASLSFLIPASITSSAPSTIPLWYFNETIGLWKEEGIATKAGDKYVGEVSHFSFWNCDVPANYIKFSCTLADNNNNPIQNIKVKISDPLNPGNSRYGYTNELGFVSGGIPNNTQLQFDVISISCENPVYTASINAGNADIDLGSITVANVASISGNVYNCNNTAITNGYVIAVQNDQFITSTVDNAGHFSFQTIVCGNNNNLMLIGNDDGQGQQGTPILVNLKTGTNTIDSLKACGVSTDEYFGLSMLDSSYSLPRSFWDVFNMGLIEDPNYGKTISIFSIAPGGNPGFPEPNQIIFTSDNISVNSVQRLTGFHAYPGLNRILSYIPVYITEYGAVGQFIAGYFSGIIVLDATKPTLVTCSFRIRRTV